MAANSFGAHPGVGHSGAVTTSLIELTAVDGPADELDLSAVVEPDPQLTQC